MESSEPSDLKPKDLRARIQARAKLTTQIQPEIAPIYGRRARALASTPDSAEISPSRRDNFVGKSFFGGSDNLTDISQNSSPLNKEFPLQNDPLIEKSQSSNLLSSEPKTVETPQLKSSLPATLVSRKLFGGVSLSLIAALIGAVVLVVMLMQKVNQLENRTKKLEDVVLSGTWSNGDTYNHKPLEDGIASNTDQINNLETLVIPDIQGNLSGIEANLSANVAKIDNLENVEIPSIQSDLSANIATTNNLENVVIPGIQSDLSANVAKTTNLENVVIPGIESDLNNVETVVIPGIQSDLSTNIATTNNLENVIIPAIQSDLSANIAIANNLQTVVIPGIQSSLSTNVAKMSTLETLTIPGIQSNISATVAKTVTLENIINNLPKFYSGKTPATAWKVYTSFGIVQTVDISSLNLANPPIVITSLAGATSHWVTVGASSVYSISKTSFTVYIRWADGANSTPLSPTDAASMGWQLQYAIFPIDP